MKELIVRSRWRGVGGDGGLGGGEVVAGMDVRGRRREVVKGRVRWDGNGSRRGGLKKTKTKRE